MRASLSQSKLVIGPHLLSVYLRRMARYACGDYKGTVNPAIQTEQFPIPTLEEIRGKVATWKRFTKIDLRSTYQQMFLDKGSQQLCTIKTRVLFRYTRLPFGISSSPAIWPRFIDQVLAGLKGTCMRNNGLLVIGCS